MSRNDKAISTIVSWATQNKHPSSPVPANNLRGHGLPGCFHQIEGCNSLSNRKTIGFVHFSRRQQFIARSHWSYHGPNLPSRAAERVWSWMPSLLAIDQLLDIM
jgi:hypothetical protein